MRSAACAGSWLPYNKAAILRAVRACADKDGERTVFNPRRVLARVVRDVLNDNIQIIRNGAFPPAGFLAQESARMGLPYLPTHIRDGIEEDYGRQEAGRLESLLTFWGRAGTAQIDDGILKAFSHQPIPSDLFDVTTGEEFDGPDKQDDKPGDGALPRSLQKQLDDIDAWSNGKLLPQALAADLRLIVREALLARIDWFDPVIREPDSATLSKAIPDKNVISRTVSIEGASENLPEAVRPLIRLKRDARTAMMFRGLVYIKAGHWRRAGDTLPRLDAIVAEHVGEAKRRVVRVLAVDDAALVHAMASLIRGAAACGQLPAKAKDLDYVNAALWLNPTQQRDDTAARAPAWLAAYRGYVAERGAVVEHLVRGIGAAQGSGAVHAVDIQRMTAIIREAKVLAASDEDLEVPAWCDKAQRKLKELTWAATGQIEDWQRLLDGIRLHLPVGVTLSETVDAITEAAKAGQSHGFVKVPDLTALADRNDTARSFDPAAITTVERLLGVAKDQSGLPLLSTIGTVVGVDLPAVADYLEYSSRWIEAGITSAEADTGTVADIDEQLKETVRTWLDIVEEPVSDD